MLEEKKNFKVNIFGKSYCIATDEHEDSVYRAVDIVNSLREEIIGQSKSPDEYQVAVMVAIKLAGKLVKAQRDCDLWSSDAKRLNDLLEENKI